MNELLNLGPVYSLQLILVPSYCVSQLLDCEPAAISRSIRAADSWNVASASCSETNSCLLIDRNLDQNRTQWWALIYLDWLDVQTWSQTELSPEWFLWCVGEHWTRSAAMFCCPTRGFSPERCIGTRRTVSFTWAVSGFNVVADRCTTELNLENNVWICEKCLTCSHTVSLFLQTKLLPKDLLAKEARNARPAQTSDGPLKPRRQNFTHQEEEEEEEEEKEEEEEEKEEEEGGCERILLSLLMNFNQCQAQRWLALYFQLINCWTHTHTHTHTHSSETGVLGLKGTWWYFSSSCCFFSQIEFVC